jgi:hypothetical protein
VFINRAKPVLVPYQDSNWGDVTFHFADGASSVGFSLQQMELATLVRINGRPLGWLHDKINGPDRDGYVRVDAEPGETIFSVTIENGSAGPNGDGLAFDHLAFNPAPTGKFRVTGRGGEQWGINDAVLGVAGLGSEEFEDPTLAAGVQVEISGVPNGLPKTSTLPATFSPTADDPNPAATFTPGVWAGERVLLNRATPPPVGYVDSNWGDVTFHFAPGVASVGFSAMNVDLPAGLAVNGVSVRGLSDVLGINTGRNGYVRIDAAEGQLIQSVTIANSGNPTGGDGIAFDHLAFGGGAGGPDCNPTLPAATITWTGAADSNWNNAANWSPSRLPNANDHVAIVGPGDVTVNLNAHATVASLRVGADSGAGTQNLVQGNFNLNSIAPGVIGPRGLYQFTGGALYGVLQIAGRMEWSGGRVFGGVRVCETARLDGLGAGAKQMSSGNNSLPAFIENRGLVVWHDGLLQAWDGAEVHNRGIWQLAAAGTAMDFCCGGNWPSFYNYGTLAKLEAADPTVFNRVGFQNRGTVNAASGPLQFNEHSDWQDGGQITGAGKVQILGGTHYFNGLLNLNGALELHGGAFRNNGRFAGPVPLVWFGGRLYHSFTIESNARLELRGTGAKQMSSGDNNIPAFLENRGQVVWQAGILQAWDRAEVQNRGSWRLEAAGTWMDYCCGGEWPSFLNQGTLAKVTAADPTVFNRVGFQNRGTVNVESGPLQFNEHSDWQDGGQLTGAGKVQLLGGTHYFNGLLNLNGALELHGGAFRNNGRFAGPVPLVWFGGRLYNSFTIESDARLEFRGPGAKQLSSGNNNLPATVENRGTVTFFEGVLQAWDNSQVVNRGIWRLEAAGNWMDYCCGGEWPDFTNHGMLAKAVAAEPTAFSRVVFQNRGTVNAASGALQFTQYSDWQDGGQITGAGKVQILGGENYFNGRLNLNAALELHGGNFRNNGRFAGPVPLVWVGGRLVNSFTIEANTRLEIRGGGLKDMSSGDNAQPAVLDNRGTVAWFEGLLRPWSGSGLPTPGCGGSRVTARCWTSAAAAIGRRSRTRGSCSNSATGRRTSRAWSSTRRAPSPSPAASCGCKTPRSLRLRV